MPRLAALTGVTVLAAALTACSGGPPQACSAIGWTNQVRVHVTGDTAGVDAVTFCAGATCPVPAPPPTLAPAPGARSLTSHDGDVWTISIDMTTPRTGHLGAFDASGAPLIDQRVMLAWKRVGGTAECGGPERAEVTLWMP
ncbi:hypothetical protein D7I44_04045 [Gryllotalpicola protaetiae]|uniref:Uncharacterized protein n=2 Tax=Gryllotalpicola protaetiae TaxID=2419771 RepID=A0A387BWR9_9MICO|nr:hypothetical protein D7I44_04045 [Gryllotalpicola protaetiae]